MFKTIFKNKNNKFIKLYNMQNENYYSKNINQTIFQYLIKYYTIQYENGKLNLYEFDYILNYIKDLSVEKLKLLEYNLKLLFYNQNLN